MGLTVTKEWHLVGEEVGHRFGRRAKTLIIGGAGLSLKCHKDMTGLGGMG